MILILDRNCYFLYTLKDLERLVKEMKKLGDKQIDFCEKCKTDRQFEISEISEYGEVFGRCNKCYNAIKL